MKASAREYVWEQIKKRMVDRSIRKAVKNANEELEEIYDSSICHLLSEEVINKITNGHRMVKQLFDGDDMDIATLDCRKRMEELLERGVSSYFSFLRNKIENKKEEEK